MRHADPETPVSLNDRASDNWRALLAIADLAGADWPRDARAAALVLSGESDDEAIGVQLLIDIRALFDKVNDPEKPLASATLVEALGAMEERPWPEWRQGKPITAPQMARLLKPFSISPRNVRTGSSVSKGYHRWQFEDAFERYLPDEASQTATPLQESESGPEMPDSARYTENAKPATALLGTRPSRTRRSGVAVSQENGVAAGTQERAHEISDGSAVAARYERSSDSKSRLL